MTELLTIACGCALIVFMTIGNALRLSLLVQFFRGGEKKNTHEPWPLPAFSGSRKPRPTVR